MKAWRRILVRALTVLPAVAVLAAQQSGNSGAKSATLVRELEDPSQFVKQPKVAVVVGESDYDRAAGFPPLQFAAQDAKDLAEALRDKEYQIVGDCPGDGPQTGNGSNGCALIGPLANYSNVKLALQEAVRRVKDGKGTLLFYFSGHGVQKEKNGKQYMVLYGGDYSHLDRNSLTVEELKNIIEGTNARKILLIDACRSSTDEEDTAAPKSPARDQTFRELAAAAGTRIMNSTKYPYPSWEDKDLGRGRFSYYLLKGLGGEEAAEPNGWITFDSLFRFVRDGVRDASNNHKGQPQEVIEDGEHTNNFYIAGNLNDESNPPLPPVVSKRSSIAVLGFKKMGGTSDEDGLSSELTIRLTRELGAGDKLRVFSEETVAKAKADLALPDTLGYTNNTLARIHKILDSDYVVSGSFKNLPGSTLRIDFRVQNAATGETVGVASETGKQTELPQLMTRAANKLRAILGILPPSEDEAAAARAALPNEQEAGRLYGDGLAKLRKYELLDAKTSLELAAKADPRVASAHLALARAWQELGYDAEATREAKTAMDLSAVLSVQSRSMIEATYSEMAAKWDKAISLYQALVTLFPDETDYALALAKVQTDAGKPQDSLATLDALRRSSEHASDDPRIDLQEAISAGGLSEFKRQHDAAARAVKNANAEGARLLSAEAYWQDCSALVELGDLKSAQDACLKALPDIAGGQRIRARGLTVLAKILEKQGRISEAMDRRQEALTLARHIGSQKDIIGALAGLANLQALQNHLAEATNEYKEAMTLAKEIGDNQQLAVLQNDTAASMYQEGEYRAAGGMYERAVQTAKETGDKKEIADGMQNLGLVLFQLGKLPDARARIQQALDMAQELRFESTKAFCLSFRGDILLAQDDLPGARKDYESALKAFDGLGDLANTAALRVSFARLLVEEGKPGEAEVSARKAVEEFQQEKAVDQEVDARLTLARALEAQGRQQEALTEIETARKLFPQDLGIRLALEIMVAKLQARGGKFAEASRRLEVALGRANRTGLVAVQLEIRLAQAEIEAASDAKLAGAHLKSIEHDATSSGFRLLAAKASRVPLPPAK